MPSDDHDVRLWTAWGAPVAKKDEVKWNTTGIDEYQQDSWFYPKKITDSKGTIWECTQSFGTNTLSYTPFGQNIYDYHITFSKDSPISCFVLHETIQNQHKPDITYEIQKNLDTPLQLPDRAPSLNQESLVKSILKYQQDRYSSLFGEKYEKDYSATREEGRIFKNKYGGSMNPRRDAQLQQLLKKQVSLVSTPKDHFEQPTKKQRRESTEQELVDPKLLVQLAAVEQSIILLGKDAKKDRYEYTLASNPIDTSQAGELIQKLKEDNFIGMVTTKTQKDGSIILEASTDKTAHLALKHGMSRRH